MSSLKILICLIATSLFINGFTRSESIKLDLVSKDQIKVYIFLHEFCKVSQYYTLTLRNLYEEFANEQIQFIGLFPNSSSKLEGIEYFKNKYQIPFELKTDYEHKYKNAFDAKIMPEVVVYNERADEIIYKGRIDDAYAKVGKRKSMVSHTELKDILKAIKLNIPYEVKYTQAIGCLINKLNKYI